MSAEYKGGVLPISVKTVARALFRDRLFNRIGNTFASTGISGPNGFRLTSNDAVFLSRVKGLSCNLRTGLLATLRHEDVMEINKDARVPVGIQLIYTAGHGLRRVIGSNRFERSLLCHVGAVRLRLPTLEREGSSVIPLTREFLHRCNSLCGGRGLHLSRRTRGGLADLP